MRIKQGSYRILVVDDHPTILEILSEFLTLKGYDVVAAQNGGKALELLAAETFDLVLTDLHMPNVDGWMVAEWAKMKHPSIHVIMFSGSIAQYTQVNPSASMFPIDEMLTKPLNLREVLSTIQRHLSSSPEAAKWNEVDDRLTRPVESTCKKHPIKS